MPYRHDALACLSCSSALEAVGRRLVCRECLSCLVPIPDVEASLHTVWPDDGTVRHEPIEGLLIPADGPVRGCPRCAQPMTVCALVGLSVDRCAAHGIWFDRHELECVLHAARPPAASDERTRGGPVTASDVVEIAIHALGQLLHCL